MTYQNAEQAYKAIKEGSEHDFMGHKLYLNKWEPKDVRKAHIDEIIDNRMLRNYIERKKQEGGLGFTTRRSANGNIELNSVDAFAHIVQLMSKFNSQLS